MYTLLQSQHTQVPAARPPAAAWYSNWELNNITDGSVDWLGLTLFSTLNQINWSSEIGPETTQSMLMSFMPETHNSITSTLELGPVHTNSIVLWSIHLELHIYWPTHAQMILIIWSCLFTSKFDVLCYYGKKKKSKDYRNFHCAKDRGMPYCAIDISVSAMWDLHQRKGSRASIH